MNRLTRWVSAWAALVVLGMTGCATTPTPETPSVRVYYSSLAAPKAEQLRSYVLVPALEDIDANDLQFQEYAGYVQRVLEARGFRPAADRDEADVMVGLSYGIGDPETEHVSYSTPVWGETGVAAVTTYGNTTFVTPRYGVTGYVSETETHTQFRRYIWLAGYDLTGSEPRQVWKTTIRSTGSSGDLRRVFPAILAAAEDAVATNTGLEIERLIAEDDPRVLRVRGQNLGVRVRD